MRSTLLCLSIVEAPKSIRGIMPEGLGFSEPSVGLGVVFPIGLAVSGPELSWSEVRQDRRCVLARALGRCVGMKIEGPHWAL